MHSAYLVDVERPAEDVLHRLRLREQRREPRVVLQSVADGGPLVVVDDAERPPDDDRPPLLAGGDVERQERGALGRLAEPLLLALLARPEEDEVEPFGLGVVAVRDGDAVRLPLGGEREDTEPLVREELPGGFVVHLVALDAWERCHITRYGIERHKRI